MTKNLTNRPSNQRVDTCFDRCLPLWQFQYFYRYVFIHLLSNEFDTRSLLGFYSMFPLPSTHYLTVVAPESVTKENADTDIR